MERKSQPLGKIVGDVSKPDGDPLAPKVLLSEIGSMVEQELLGSIHAHYPMIEIQDYVVMPDHLHFIVVVHHDIVSSSGRETHLGQVIAGFKKGCNRRYWDLTDQIPKDKQGKPAPASIPSTPCPPHAVSTPCPPPAAAAGSVLVSARIAKGEQDIMNVVMSQGYPVVTVEDNGFPALFHPSNQRTNLCSDSKLLLISPWNYVYRHASTSISVAECKTMNCIVQSLCRTKDSWWKG